MTERADFYLPFQLHVTAGPLELSPVTDEDIPGLIDLALDGIHPEDEMPFYYPWTKAAPDTLGRNMAQFYWKARQEFSPGEWTLNLAVRHEGELVGCQDFQTNRFHVTLTGETGSWLAARHQGKGIGTAMRQAICALAFDHFGATEVTSGAFLDNPRSQRVSEKVGYRPNGTPRRPRRLGELATVPSFRLARSEERRVG